MATSPWQNRITKYSEEDPSQLLANPMNWRTHNGSQADALRGVLSEVGIVQNVLANERTGYLIDGHLRVMEALKSGQPTIPVTWVDVSKEEEALILATLDPIAALAGTDAAKLDALLREVSTSDAGVMQLLDELAFDVETISIDDGGSEGSRALAAKPSAVTAVFSVAQLAVVEQAIRAAENPNRGEALVSICEAYLAERQ